MPRIEYKKKKIKRKFTPEWASSGKVNIDEELPKYINALIAQKKAMVEYTECLWLNPAVQERQRQKDLFSTNN